MICCCLVCHEIKGLEKAICVFKTKIMIFNKKETKNCSFQIDGKDLEIVKSYVYLG